MHRNCHFMEISALQSIYAGHPNAKALASLLENSSVKTIFLEHLCASSTALFVSSFLKRSSRLFVMVLNDLEDAGYFYHDLVQNNGETNKLFFQSSYLRDI